MIRTLLAVLLILVVLHSCNKKQSCNDQIAASIDQLVTENNIPGLNLSIIYADGKQENYSAGLADVENMEKLTEQHVLFSGSIGKIYMERLNSTV